MSNTTYWAHNGKYQKAVNAIESLIPTQGGVEYPRSKNRHLERCRKAINCYYDLYNNGLCNRQREFNRLFEIQASWYKMGNSWHRFDSQLYAIVEKKMDQFIQAAAIEQNIEYC